MTTSATSEKREISSAAVEPMDVIVERRVKAILDAHANNLIEGLDMGADVLAAMLERAREPISDEEFTRREEALLAHDYGL